MHRRALFALVLVLAGSALTATTAAAESGSRDPVVDLVVRDCSKDNDLDVDYPLEGVAPVAFCTPVTSILA